MGLMDEEITVFYSFFPVLPHLLIRASAMAVLP